MDNYQNRYYALLVELGEQNHNNAKLQYELDYLNGVGHVSTAYATMLINKAILRLNDDLYLQGDVEDATKALWEAKRIINGLSYGEMPFDDDVDGGLNND